MENFLNEIVKNKAKFSKLPSLPILKDVSAVEYANTVENEDKDEGCNEHQCTDPSEDES